MQLILKARIELALLFDSDGVVKNEKEAIRLYKLVAESNEAVKGVVFSSIARIYETGGADVRNIGEAVRFQKLAADFDWKEKVKLFNLLVRHLKPTVQRNVLWTGFLDSSDTAGKLVAFERLYSGIGVPKDKNAAIEIIQELALARDPIAILICVQKGIMLTSDDSTGMATLLKSCPKESVHVAYYRALLDAPNGALHWSRATSNPLSTRLKVCPNFGSGEKNPR